MSDRPERIPLVRQWVAKAEEDIRTAEYTLTMPENCPHGTICLLAGIFLLLNQEAPV